MMRRICCAMVCLSMACVLLLAIALPANGQTMTFSADRDAPILPAFGLSNTNFGGSTILATGSISGDERSLISFDVSALSGQFTQIDSITLRLFVSSVDGNSTLNTHVHAIDPDNRAWVEGAGNVNGGGPTNTGDNTWNSRNHNVVGGAWAGSAGLGTVNTDYDATLLSSETFVNGSYPTTGTAIDFEFTGTTAELTDLIDAWLVDNVDLSQDNPGLLLFDPNGPTLGGTQRIQFHSREATNENFRPQLFVTFSNQMVPEPSSVLVWGLVGGVLAVVALAWRKCRRAT